MFCAKTAPGQVPTGKVKDSRWCPTSLGSLHKTIAATILSGTFFDGTAVSRVKQVLEDARNKWRRTHDEGEEPPFRCPLSHTNKLKENLFVESTTEVGADGKPKLIRRKKRMRSKLPIRRGGRTRGRWLLARVKGRAQGLRRGASGLSRGGRWLLARVRGRATLL